MIWSLKRCLMLGAMKSTDFLLSYASTLTSRECRVAARTARIAILLWFIQWRNWALTNKLQLVCQNSVASLKQKAAAKLKFSHLLESKSWILAPKMTSLLLQNLLYSELRKEKWTYRNPHKGEIFIFLILKGLVAPDLCPIVTIWALIAAARSLLTHGHHLRAENLSKLLPKLMFIWGRQLLPTESTKSFSWIKSSISSQTVL
jgi:hypothetical protein